MNVIEPIKILDVNLIASNVPENLANWSAATTYSLGAIVQFISLNTHLIFESVFNGSNLNNNPLNDPQDIAAKPPTYWLLKGVTNTWKMFDLDANTKTENLNEINITIMPNKRFTSLALLGLENANYAVVTMSVAGSVIYTKTENLLYRNISNWYEYLFAPFISKKTMLILNFPLSSTAQLNIKIVAITGQMVKCGGFVLGTVEHIGFTRYQATSKLLSFSKVARSFDGTAKFLRRKSVPDNNYVVSIKKADAERIKDLRQRLDNVPSFWFAINDAGDDYFDILQLFGFCKAFNINVENPVDCFAEIQLEGI